MKAKHRSRSGTNASGSVCRDKQAVKFSALLRRIDIKSLRSMDKGAAVTFEIDDPADELIDKLNRIMRADEMVNVGVWA
jgi:hypothetical protein